MLTLLASVRADVQALDQFGQTALHQAALFGHVRAIQALVGLGALLESRNSLGAISLGRG